MKNLSYHKDNTMKNKQAQTSMVSIYVLNKVKCQYERIAIFDNQVLATHTIKQVLQPLYGNVYVIEGKWNKTYNASHHSLQLYKG